MLTVARDLVTWSPKECTALLNVPTKYSIRQHGSAVYVGIICVTGIELAQN